MTAPSKTVLILDKDEVTRELYRRELERHFRVITVADEAEAWDVIEMGAVDGVVLEPTALADEEWDFIVRVRASERHQRLPVVVYSTLDARRRGAQLGVTVYLIKPVTPQLLIRTLQSVMHDTEPAARP